MAIWNHPYYGVCYYPEHWDAARHAEDIKRIAGAGFDVVRMGESAWGYWEPAEGHFQFDLFDRVIDLCARHGVKVILGTPTYAAPAWVSAKYPEVLRWNFQRIPMAHGSRRNLNYTSPKYLELSDRICTALAAHYRKHPQVIGWQLDNEFNCHMDVSYAPSDSRAFRAWLHAKYKTIARLNAAWGTAFWSQQYDNWQQVDLPAPTATYLNPSQLLDESRFISDMVVRFAARQAALLRQANAQWKITHNALFFHVNGPDLVKQLDFFGHDHYPQFGATWWDNAFPLQRARALSFPFAVLEQQSGPGGQMQYLHATPQPGQLRLWAFQSIAHGTKSLLYFRWRTCPYGSEQHWHGLLDQDNRDTRRLAEAQATGAEFKALPRAFHDAPVVRCVGVMGDYDNDVNQQRIDTYTHDGNSATHGWLAEFSRRHIAADFVWPASDLDGYRLLIVPHFRIVDQALVARLKAFVAAGGTLLLGARSGLKNLHNHVVEMPLPGLLAKLAGVVVDDWTSLQHAERRHAVLPDGTQVPLGVFVEALTLQGAQAVARWDGADRVLGTTVALAAHRVGQGRVLYVGGYADRAGTAALGDYLARTLRLQPVVDAPEQVETVLRQRGRKQWLCVLNHAGTKQAVRGIAGRNLLTDAPVDGELILDAYGVAVVERKA